MYDETNNTQFVNHQYYHPKLWQALRVVGLKLCQQVLATGTERHINAFSQFPYKQVLP